MLSISYSSSAARFSSFCSRGVGCRRSTHVVWDIVFVGCRLASSVRWRWNRRNNWRLYRWLTASFGHGIALRNRVVGANWIAKRDGSAAAFHPSLHEAERERRARETIVPPHTKRFRLRGSPSSVRFFSLPVPYSSLCTLAADCPPSSHTATSAHPPPSASGLRDCDGPWSGVVWGNWPVVGVVGRGAVGVGLGWGCSRSVIRACPSV